MRMRISVAGSMLAVLFSVTLLTQSTSTAPGFQTVSIRAKAPAPDVDVVNPMCTGRCSAGVIDQGRVMFAGTSMLRIIAAAYGVKAPAVFGGPQWLATDRFDIYAKTDSSTPREKLESMFQALLAERFGLVVRREQKPMPIYVLKLGADKLRMQEVAHPGPAECKGTVPASLANLSCENQTMSGLAAVLTNALPYIVIDETNLKGGYNFSLKFKNPNELIRTPADPGFNPDTDISADDAVAKLGLKLERELQPAPVIVIDRVNRTPSGEMVGELPVVPTEFEVAEVCPMAPNAPGRPDRYLPSGQIEMHGWTLQRLVKLAYDVSDDALVGAPKWFESDRFDILAKTSITREELQVARAANGLSISGPAMYAEMLKGVLATHFKLAVHTEVQPITVYGLTVGDRLNLKKSSSSERSVCTEIIAVGGSDSLTCQNLTLTQLAPRLHRVANISLGAHAVVDLTGLKDTYDMAVKWTMGPLVNASMANRSEEGSAPDPMGYITIFEALERQLGLKVVTTKHPMSVVVIDHVERN